jgi:Ca-activated chloride channel homolog
VIFTFAYPWLLCWLAVPILVRWLMPPHREPRQGLVIPFLDRLAAQAGQTPSEGAIIIKGGWLRRVSLIVFWLLIAIALARPQIIEPPISKTIPERDLLLAVDLSGSMATQDFANPDGKKVDRLTAVKGVLEDFLSRRKGDRIGLIFFGTAPFVQAPFTEDILVCRQLLDEAQVNMAGPQTAFGDAIGLAITLFGRSSTKEKVLIALTDGNDTSSKVPPAKAAEIAADKGIKIYTVAVGDPRAAGEDALDIEALKHVAETTGGLFSFAADRRQLDEIYHHLDQIEVHQAKTISHRPRRDIFFWPLGIALLVSFLQHGLQLLLTRSRTGKTTSGLPLPHTQEITT